MSRRFTLLSTVLCALLSLPMLAHADAALAPAKEASARFRRGVELYRQESYLEAIVEFEQAYQAAPDYRVLYNVAESKVQLADYLGAARSYQRYLDQGGAQIASARREQVALAIEKLGQHIGGIAVQCDREGAEVRLDGSTVGQTPIAEPIAANAGEHVLSVRPANEAPQEQRFALAGGGVARLEFRYGPVQPLSLEVTHEPPPPPARSRVRRSALGTGMAAIPFAIASAVSGAIAARAQNEVKASASNPSRVRDEQQRRDRYVVSAAALAGVAGTLGVGSLVLLFMDRQRAERAEVRGVHLALSPLGAAELTLRF